MENNSEEGQGSQRAVAPVMMIMMMTYFFLSFLLVYLFFCNYLLLQYTLTLYCVCPLCSYVYLRCAVSVIGLIAVDSAHK
jgi:hypothetical protein